MSSNENSNNSSYESYDSNDDDNNLNNSKSNNQANLDDFSDDYSSSSGSGSYSSSSDSGSYSSSDESGSSSSGSYESGSYESVSYDSEEFHKYDRGAQIHVIPNGFKLVEDATGISERDQIEIENEPQVVEVISSLIQEYNIIDELQPGDIIQLDIDENIYRNDGKYIWDGTQVLCLDSDVDEYGAVPRSFTFPTFALDHWDHAVSHNLIRWLEPQIKDQIKSNYKDAPPSGDFPHDVPSAHSSFSHEGETYIVHAGNPGDCNKLSLREIIDKDNYYMEDGQGFGYDHYLLMDIEPNDA